MRVYFLCTLADIRGYENDTEVLHCLHIFSRVLKNSGFLISRYLKMLEEKNSRGKIPTRCLGRDDH